MSKLPRYKIAKCSIEKSCPKCSTMSDPIVVNRNIHYTMYCSKCGAYIKHASIEDKRYFYGTSVFVNDETPVKVCMLYIDSEKTMVR